MIAQHNFPIICTFDSITNVNRTDGAAKYRAFCINRYVILRIHSVNVVSNRVILIIHHKYYSVCIRHREIILFQSTNMFITLTINN